jgi:hypothetical protein
MVFNEGEKDTRGIGSISNSIVSFVIGALHDPDVLVIPVNTYLYLPAGRLEGMVYVSALPPVLFPLPVIEGVGKIPGL